MSHYYQPDGTPAHFAGPNGRPTGPAIARKLGLLPSVTTILNDVLRKPGLERWIIQQNLLAVLTAPDLPGEAIDTKVTRILETERQQDQESKVAMDRGTKIHEALEFWFGHTDNSKDHLDMIPWIEPAAKAIEAYGTVHAVEKVLVGDGYAGKCDLIQECPGGFRLWDWKTCKKLPEKGAWNEHRIQTSAYARAFDLLFSGTPESVRPSIDTGNVYISTVDCGKFVIHEHEPWPATYANAFLPLLTVFKWMNNV